MDPAPELLAEIDRLAKRTFGEVPARQLADGLPILSRLAAEAPRPVPGVTPLRQLIAAAAERITAPDLRMACRRLFGLTDQTYGRAFRVRQEEAARAFEPPVSLSAFRQSPRYRKRIYAELAAVLTATVPAAPPSPRRPASGPAVEREPLIAEALSLLNRARPAVAWLWGEPGTGKSVLAHQVAERLATVAGPAFVVHAENERMRHDEVLALLTAHGVDAREWTEPASVAYLHGMLARGELRGVLILDDLSHPYTLDRFVPPEPRSRVVVTSRTRPAADAAEPVRVAEFTGEEAALVARALLPTITDEQLTRLVALVGARPIAVDHVCRFVAATPGQSIDTVLDGLADELPETLHAVQSAQRIEATLTVIYRDTVAALGPESDAIALLTCIVWTIGADRTLAALRQPLFDRHFPGPAGAIRVAAATTVLADRGIVTVENDVYEVHSLTLGIFRRFLRRGRTRVLGDFLEVLREPVAGRVAQPFAELKATEGLWAGHLFNLDQMTWVWFRETTPGTDIRWYDVAPSGVWCSRNDDDRQLLAEPDLTELVHMTRNYLQAVSLIHHRPAGRTALEEANALSRSPTRTSGARLAEVRAAAERGDGAAALDWFDQLALLIAGSSREPQHRDGEELLEGVRLAAKVQEPAVAADLYRRMIEFLARAVRSETGRAIAGNIFHRLTSLVVDEKDQGLVTAVLAHLATAVDQLDDGTGDTFVMLDRAAVHTMRGTYLAYVDPALAVEAFTTAAAQLRQLIAIRPQDASLWSMLAFVLDYHLALAGQLGTGTAELRAAAAEAHRRLSG